MMSAYQIIYKGIVDTGEQEVALLEYLAKRLRLVDLPWDTEMVFTIGERTGLFSCCALLEGKEQLLKEALELMIKTCPESYGAIGCYGDHAYDVRRLVIRNGRMYEQTCEIEYADPGKIIFVA